MVKRPTSAIFRRQAVADHEEKGEIRVGLRLERGQGEGHERAKTFVQPLRGIEIGDPVFERLVLDLKPAQRRIGKAAQTDDLHGVGPFLPLTPPAIQHYERRRGLATLSRC